MASVGHLAVGMAAARINHAPRRPLAALPTLGAMVFWSALALLPDADIIGRWFGVRYSSQWGHRGFTHSLAFAVVAGLCVAAIGRRWRRPFQQTWLVAVLVLLSHPVLDMMTDGGLGCAFFWPVDRTRYFLPWNPIPVAPMGLAFLSARGVVVGLIELVMFLPVWAFAVWPPRR